MDEHIRKIVVSRPGSPNKLRLRTCAPPVPAGGEVLIRVDAAGVNFADCVARMGLYQSAWEMVGYPFTPGFEVAGTVASASRESRFRVGDHVVAVTRFGGYSELVAVPEVQVFKLPPTMSSVDAASVPVSFLTALYAVE